MQPVKNVQLASNDIKLLAMKGYTVGDALNSGSFACVSKATYKGKPAAVKVINLEKTSDDYRIKFLPRELYIIKKIRHRYIVKVIDIYVIANSVFVFMELADGGDFLDLLQAEGALTEKRARYFYVQYGDAYRYMHNMGFAHRDIKCENILLNKQRTHAKVTDFGFTRSCIERQSGQRMLSETYCGSRAYLAPEVLKAEKYNPLLSDVWSIGVVLFVLLQDRFPFNDRDWKSLRKSQLERSYYVSSRLSASCKDIIHAHLNPNPSTRANMMELLQHEWLGADKTSLEDGSD
ncbi:PREDICTED: testis-specific serine/threonine-protein kinase 2-like [Rhagoletis zephyria]|uniref:testis-specific serine/threonine-protein kinase 2-like n=1 Tax=Rhagoletis zephyria TaxID=28612 RepID=UPI000811248D|nr:PREDICTED: testis-specific serine/threonine-protein kinase 2-like [Rhagoletis zephyria]KAH9409619.1 hypothetical protein TYRP_010629 [Tyrophagus putrescentiae]